MNDTVQHRYRWRVRNLFRRRCVACRRRNCPASDWQLYRDAQGWPW